jgi:hypothetical protein
LVFEERERERVRETERERKDGKKRGEKLNRNKYRDCEEVEGKELLTYWQPGGGALVY